MRYFLVIYIYNANPITLLHLSYVTVFMVILNVQRRQKEHLDWPQYRSEFFRRILRNEIPLTNGSRRMHGSSFNLSSKFLFQYRQIQRAQCIRENADATATQEFRNVCVAPQRTLQRRWNEPFRTLASSILRVSWRLPRKLCRRGDKDNLSSLLTF